MKLPRDISGEFLTHKLKKLGYTKTRQSGSHIRLTTSQNGIHNITIPNHSPIKVGTISGILQDVATHFKVSKEDIMEQLFNS